MFKRTVLLVSMAVGLCGVSSSHAMHSDAKFSKEVTVAALAQKFNVSVKDLQTRVAAIEKVIATRLPVTFPSTMGCLAMHSWEFTIQAYSELWKLTKGFALTGLLACCADTLMGGRLVNAPVFVPAFIVASLLATAHLAKK